MTILLFANNAASTLAGPISSVATSVTLAAGTGALFPAPAAGQAFKMTFISAANPNTREIVLVTAVSGDTLTIVRGQESTSAANWNAGDFAENRLTAGSMSNFAQTPNVLVLAPQGTFYVNFSTGSDSTGNGLTAGTAWATIQHAIDFISQNYIYFGVMTIQCANGIFTVPAGSSAASFGPSSIASWALIGNAGSPSSCAINASATGARGVIARLANVFLSGFQITSYLEGAQANTKGSLTVASCAFIGVSSSTFALAAYASSYCAISSNSSGVSTTVTLSGTFGGWITSNQGSYVQVGYVDINVSYPVVITTASTPTFATYGVLATLSGVISFSPSMLTFSGTGATGVRYLASTNGVIGTNGSGANYLPGNAAGSVLTGGQYS